MNNLSYSGYYCPNCQRWVGTYEVHQCPNQNDYPILPSVFSYPVGYNYKCPCGGEFNSPAYNNNSTSSNGNPNYRCPFCGRKMEGLA
jgi:hypothetical protein